MNRLFFLFLALFYASPALSEEITVIEKLNYNKKSLLKCVEIDNKEFAPVSELSKIFDLKVIWNPVTKKLILKKKDSSITLVVGSSIAWINERRVMLQEAVCLREGNFYIPLDFVIYKFEDFLKCKIKYNGVTRSLTIEAVSPKESYSLSERKNSLLSPSSVSYQISPLPEERNKDSPPDSFRIKRIVIDPGHGGKDPGARGRYLDEKDANLKIAKKLKDLLLKRLPEVSVFLTREDDTFIPLAKRASFAEEMKADLFISVHNNAAFSGKAHGFEVYHLSFDASDDAARAVAALENSAISFEENMDVERVDYNTPKFILGDMEQTRIINESAELAGFIQTSVCERLNLENRGIKSAFFYVLRNTLMPAVLIEVAFVSNPNEEMLLLNEGFIDVVASSISEGIIRYKKHYERNLGFKDTVSLLER